MERAILILALVVVLGPLAQGGQVIKMKNGTLTLEGSLISKPNGSSPFSGLADIKIKDRFFPTLDRIYYIVQFDGPILPQWRAKLTTAGVKVGSYLPDDAYLARVQSPQEWRALNASEHVRAVVPYATHLRLSQELDQKKNQNQAIAATVKLIFGDELRNFLFKAKERGIEFVLQGASGRTLQIKTMAYNFERLADIEGVEWIEEAKPLGVFDFEISASDVPPTPVTTGNYTDLTGYESGTKLMDFDDAYARGLHGEGEIVGIADTGLDTGSTTDILDDLKGQILKGYALGFFSKTWADPQGHGTHTSGSILGTGITSGGRLRGGAYKAQLVMQGLWSPMLNNLSIIPDFNKLFGVARQNDNVHIHSNSWGYPASLGAYDNFASMVDEIAWQNPDLLIVFAAGNSGVDADKDGHIDEGSVSSPGTAKNCLTVGASKNLVLQGGIQKTMKELRNGADDWGVEPIASSRLSDNPKGMAAFSSIGPTNDGRLKPEIVAPGTNIISTRDRTPGASTLWGAYNDSYVYAGGTSMATPLTAGAAAVVRQYLRQIGFADPSAALLKAVLIDGATDLFPGQFGDGPGREFKTTRPNVNEGFGRVDVGHSTQIAASHLVDETRGLRSGETKIYLVTVKQGSMLRATMVYTDAPASAGAAQALVNDLDLKVTDDKGKVFYPNHLNGPDEANNTEMVEFTPDHSGTFTVSVFGRNIPKGQEGTDAQPYALVLP